MTVFTILGSMEMDHSLIRPRSTLQTLLRN